MESQKTRSGINSLFGVGTFSYKNTFYLDATFRQDWNSTLVNPEAGIDGSDFSYLYPSASLTVILSEMFGMSTTSPVSFLKL